MEIKFDEAELELAQKAEKYCAVSEQCMSSVRAKLFIWGASRPQAEKVIKHLCANNFINEQRYAESYSSSKVRLQHWGRIKIAYQLRAKQIPQNIIDNAIESINIDDYRKSLIELTHSRWEMYPDGDFEKNRRKLMAFLATKGFEMDIIKEVVDLELPLQ